MKKYKFVLNLFDGAGAAPGGEGTSSVNAGDATGTSVKAGDATSTGDNSADAGQNDTKRPTFKELIDGDYKAEADEYISKMVKSRVGESKKMKDAYTAQQDILSVVASKYGVDPSDYEGLKSAVEADDSYYEQRAYDEGLTVDQLRRIDDAERKAKKYDQLMLEQDQNQRINETVNAWRAEADQLKTIFPEFDLDQELQNPAFQNLLKAGVTVRQAYVSMHDVEIMNGAMQYTAQEVRKATAADIAARGTRPQENASSSQAPANVKIDVSKLTNQDIEDLIRRAQSGERIEF